MKKFFTSTLLLSLSIFSIGQYTLTIDDVTFSNGVITNYLNTIEKDIIIPDNFNGEYVITVGSDAFRNNGLTGVSIPNSVTTISSLAFYENSLTEVIIPNSVISIGASAFNKNSIISITLGNSITTISYKAFYGNQLSSVTIPNSVTFLGKYTFALNDLTEVNLSNSLKEISQGAFYDNEISSIDIPSSLVKIGPWAFDVNQITYLSIPNTISIIDQGAFRSNLLTNIEIPNSITTIGPKAFFNNQISQFTIPTPILTGTWSNVSSGQVVTDLETSYIFSVADYTAKDNDFSFNNGKIHSYHGPAGSIIIPNKINGEEVFSIGSEAFASCHLNEIIIPNSVTNIEGYAFYSNDLSGFTLPSPTLSGAWDTGNSGETTSNLSTGYNFIVDNYTTTDKDFIFDNGTIIEYIGPKGSIIIPTSINNQDVVIIGTSAFKNKGITDVTLPNTLTQINNSAFYGNSFTTSLIIPNSITTIGESAFSSSSLTNVVIGNSVIDIQDYAFSRNSISGHITLPNSLISIGDEAFWGNQITELTLGNSIENIDNGAFGVNNLSSITLPSSLKHLGQGAFGENNSFSSLQEFTLPSDENEALYEWDFQHQWDGTSGTKQSEDVVTVYGSYTRQGILNSNDITSPVIDISTFEAELTFECSSTTTNAPRAMDDIDGTIIGTTITQFPVTKSTEITWTFSDNAGNISTTTQDIIINDQTAPLPEKNDLDLIKSECEVTELTSPSATDNCSNITVSHNAILPIIESITITWTYTDAAGNTSTQLQEVEIFHPIVDNTIESITSPGTPSVNSLISNENDTDTYQWYSCETEKLIQGANSQEFQPSILGNYKVVISKLCVSKTSICSDELVINNLSASSVSTHFQVYPNPSSEVINIESLGLELFEIYDVSGSLILTSSKALINIKNLNNGIYVIKQGTRTTRFIKQ